VILNKRIFGDKKTKKVVSHKIFKILPNLKISKIKNCGKKYRSLPVSINCSGEPNPGVPHLTFKLSRDEARPKSDKTKSVWFHSPVLFETFNKTFDGLTSKWQYFS